MKSITFPCVLVAGALLATAPAVQAQTPTTTEARAAASPMPAAPVATDPATLLPHGHMPRPGLLTGGQPSAEQLAALAAAGYKTIVSLRTDKEEGTRQEDVERLGMRFVHIPVAGAAGLTEENARALADAMASADAFPMAIHCASGNRVGALLAIEAKDVEGLPSDEALKLGLDAGLTGLEGDVEALLGLAPGAPTEH